MMVINVLIAEDNPADIFLVQQALEEYEIPHVLHIASDGEKAIQLLDQVGKSEAPCPDLIILDINLPKIDGIEILKRVRKHEHCIRTPVIVYSSSGNPVEKAMTEGLVSSYFRKPPDYAAYMEIGRLVLQVLEEKEIKLDQ